MEIGENFTGIYEDTINGKQVLIEYKNGKKDGITRYFSNNGKIAIEIEYHDDIINGKIKTYDEFGNIVMDATYSNSNLTGEVTTYYSNGMPQRRSQYKDGKQCGTSITYDTFGDISIESMWKDGKQTGPELIYYPKSIGGNIYSRTEYVNGERHGMHIKYAQDGEVLSMTTYKFGRAQEYPRVLGNN